MKTVVATGVFDVIHPGHILFLTEARRLGDRLVVVVARDKTAEEKKRRPLIPEQQRLEVVSALKPVDEAVLGDELDFIEPIRTLKPDVIALGADQEVSDAELREKISAEGLSAEVVRIHAHWTGPINSSKEILEKIREL